MYASAAAITARMTHASVLARGHVASCSDAIWIPPPASCEQALVQTIRSRRNASPASQPRGRCRRRVRVGACVGQLGCQLGQRCPMARARETRTVLRCSVVGGVAASSCGTSFPPDTRCSSAPVVRRTRRQARARDHHAMKTAFAHPTPNAIVRWAGGEDTHEETGERRAAARWNAVPDFARRSQTHGGIG